MEYVFEIPGIPVAKQRPRFSTRNGFGRSYTPDKTINYENLVKMQYCIGDSPKFDGAVKATVILYFPIPKSTSKKKYAQMISGEIRHTKKPDVDNCLKAIFDALNGIAYDDDSQIVEVIASKWYSENPGAKVKLEDVKPVEIGR